MLRLRWGGLLYTACHPDRCRSVLTSTTPWVPVLSLLATLHTPAIAVNQVVEAGHAFEVGVPRAAALVDAASPVDSVDLTKVSGGFVAQDPYGSGF